MGGTSIFILKPIIFVAAVNIEVSLHGVVLLILIDYVPAAVSWVVISNGVPAAVSWVVISNGVRAAVSWVVISNGVRAAVSWVVISYVQLCPGSSPAIADWFFHHRIQKFINAFYVGVLGATDFWYHFGSARPMWPAKVNIIQV